MPQSCARGYFFHLFLILLLWLKLRDVQPLLLTFLCGWSSVFIQLLTPGLFWIDSRYWTLQVPLKSRSMVQEEEGRSCTEMYGRSLLHCWCLNGIVGSGLNLPSPSGLRTIIVNSDYYGSSEIRSLLCYSCLDDHWLFLPLSFWISKPLLMYLNI